MHVMDFDTAGIDLCELLEALPYGAWILNAQGVYVFQNSVDIAAFGDLAGKRAVETWVPEDQAADWHQHHERALKGERVRYSRHVTTRDGSQYIETVLVPLMKEGQVTGAVGLAVNNTPWMTAQNEADQARALLDDVLESIPDALAAYNSEDRLILFNAAYKDLYSYSAPAIRLGEKFETILRYGLEAGQYLDAGTAPEEKEKWLRTRLANHRNPPGKALIQKLPNGRWLHVRERKSASGNIVGVRTDVTALKAAEVAVRQTAETDSLTGIANRSVLITALQRTLKGSRSSDRMGALILLDVDHFKSINDTLGHDAGDLVLKTVAKRLRQTLRGEDTLARLGGDEFAVLVTGFEREEACEVVANTLHKALTKEMPAGNRMLRPGISMGIALFPRDGTTVDELFKNADSALYKTKENGRNGWTLFDEQLGRRLHRVAEVKTALSEALLAGSITVALQPIVNISTGRHHGFESLARWNRQGEDMPPFEFVAIAEDAGMGLALGQELFEKSCQSFAALERAGLGAGTLSVNLGLAQLKCDNLPAMLRESLVRHGLTPDRLVLEITETVLIDRSACQIGRTLERLHDLGFQLSLDDFGTGFASLTHLRQFPVTGVKIDRSFTTRVTTSRQDAVIVETMIHLAKGLGISIVAEGVEDERQLAFLKDADCTYAQGYFLAPPLRDAASQRVWLGARPAKVKAARN
ncbi:putative bifunctional diguanylate cyclase/phosphodiesterase [Pannonibacter phragmitetus]|uniref:putative bifunctional diguanylate cyclase/phosphodiesterase n=1 Tax=Pannonibacter phragmitetus TaxID=121719 RepID=UPI000B96B505|nr:EAL domain-containing protein [Pannonibacter phragmitetus]